MRNIYVHVYVDRVRRWLRTPKCYGGSMTYPNSCRLRSDRTDTIFSLKTLMAFYLNLAFSIVIRYWRVDRTVCTFIMNVIFFFRFVSINLQLNIHSFDCVSACSTGTYGELCEKRCHCLDGTRCDSKSGACPGYCQPGWEGVACDRRKYLRMMLFFLITVQYQLFENYIWVCLLIWNLAWTGVSVENNLTADLV